MMANGDDDDQSYWDGDNVDQDAPPRTLEGGLPERTPTEIPREDQRKDYTAQRKRESDESQ